MHEMIDELYELCGMLEKDLKKTNEKLHKAGGELSGPDMEYVDRLTHSLKSIKATIAMIEYEDSGYSQAGGDWEATGRMNGTYGGGNSYANRGKHRVREHYSRSDGRRRDMRGRYSGDDGFRNALEEAADRAPDDRTRERLERMAREA